MPDDRDTPRAAPGEGTHPDGITWIYGALSDIPKIITESLTYLQKVANEYGNATPEDYQATINGIADTITKSLQGLVKENAVFAENEEAIAAYSESQLEDGPEELKAIAPFLLAELKADPDHADTPIEEAYRAGTDARGNLTDSPYREHIKRAQERAAVEGALSRAVSSVKILRQTANEIGGTEAASTEEILPRVQYKRTTELKTVTDKLTNVFFSLTAPASSTPDVNGQRKMTPLRYESQKAKKEVTLFYDYVYNEDVLDKYGLSKKFDDFDFFVMTIIDTLYSAGNDLVSFTKIYNEMGGEGSPTSKQLEPIYYSVLKGLSTTITIDDAEAQKAWNTDKTGTYHEIISPVIPVQIGNERFIANGRIANGFVKINGFSPFMQVAKPLGHLTAWDKKILRLYTGKRTKRYYSVLRFLMLQIGWMRNGDRSNKILYSSLYQYTGDTTARAQQLARDMMYRLLDEVFKPAGYITAYREKADPSPGVVLTMSENRQRLSGKQ